MRISSRENIDLYQRDLVLILLLNLEEGGLMPVSMEDLHLLIFPTFIESIEKQRGQGSTAFFRDLCWGYYPELTSILFHYKEVFLVIGNHMVMYADYTSRLQNFVDNSVANGHTLEDLAATKACALFSLGITPQQEAS